MHCIIGHTEMVWTTLKPVLKLKPCSTLNLFLFSVVDTDKCNDAMVAEAGEYWG